MNSLLFYIGVNNGGVWKTNDYGRTWTPIAEGADARPTSQAITAYDQSQKTLINLLMRWKEMKTRDVSELNEKLREANLPQVKLQ